LDRTPVDKMKQFQKIVKKCNSFLISRQLNLTLFIILILLMVLLSILPQYETFFKIPVKTVLAVLGLNLFLCTLSNYKTLSIPVLVMHLGFLVSMAASLIQLMGYVATINLHINTSTTTAFRWDKNKDLPLGFDMLVEEVGREWYPIDVKIGVLKNGVKSELHETRTGETITIDGYLIRVISLDPETKELLLAVLDSSGKLLGEYSTTKGPLDVPETFQLSFKLVAYKDPILKRIWTTLKLSRGNKTLIAGRSEVNAPLVWNEEDLRFYLTKVGIDDFGNSYAGIQIVKDPSPPFVYSGFSITLIGVAWYFTNLIRKSKKIK